MFRGSLVPLITPFRNGQIDDEAFRGLVEWHIESGSHGITITGTTGEPAALSFDERKHIRRARDASRLWPAQARCTTATRLP
jgi:4-hydroxy-tetrahydrodipicolinate synthase